MGDFLRGFTATVAGFFTGIVYDAVSKAVVAALDQTSPKSLHLAEIAFFAFVVLGIEGLVDDVTSLIVSSVAYVLGAIVGYAVVGDSFGLIMGLFILGAGVLLRAVWGFQPQYDM